MTTTNETAACSCGILSGSCHPDGFSKEFGGPAVAWNVGYKTAHDTADYHRSQGDKARVFYEPGVGWAVQVRS